MDAKTRLGRTITAAQAGDPRAAADARLYKELAEATETERGNEARTDL